MEPRKQLLPKWAVYALFGFLCVALLFVLRSIRPQDPHTTYSLIFQDIYSKAPTVEIGSFNEGEPWRGIFTLDTERTIDGETGMNIFSMNAVPARVTIAKQMNLRPYNTLYAYLYVDKDYILPNIKSLSLTFTDSKNKHATYEIQDLKTGWNFVEMQMADFKPKGIDTSSLVSAALELVSKKEQSVQISVDRIWAQQPLRSDDFTALDPSRVNLKTETKKTYLHIATPKPTSLTFAKSTDVNHFIYTVGLSPLKYGNFGMSFLTDSKLENGYIAMISGKNMDEWHLLKKENGKETELQHGTLSQNTFEKGAMIWLRVEKKGSNITFSVTLNGQQYVPITELKDNTFRKGSIGIVATGSYLIESVDFKE